MSAGRLEIDGPQAQHRGLYLDKFVPEEREAQKAALQQLTRPLESAVYRLAFKRWKDHWMSQGERVVCGEGAVRDRLAVGLGAESVLENGVRLHFVYGTPVVPGSSLKGVLRAGLPREHRNEAATDGRNVEWYLFGDEDSPGKVKLHDAWWVPDDKPPLAVDVLTPHHQKYLQRQGPPTDYDEPVPVHFLTVRGRFLFVVETPNASWRDYMKALLTDTLRREGAGAKRSAGYGAIEVR